MTWRCALVQRWLPGYLDAEADGIRKRLVERHLKQCPRCRQELADLEATIRLVQAHPVPDPGPEFWEAFQRELHLKLAELQHREMPAPKRHRLPYALAAAPLLFLLVVGVGWWRGYLPGLPSREAGTPAPPAAALPAPVAPPQKGEVELVVHGGGASHPPGPEKVLYAGIDEGLWDDDLVLNWDVDPVLADLSPEEREALARRLTGREP